MKAFFIALFTLAFSLGLTAQIRIDSAFAFGPDTAKKYSIYVPSSYSSSTPNEMMVGFHPFNTSRWNSKSWCDTLLAFSEMNDLILVCPDGDSLGIITDSLDYAFTTALIDSVKNWYSIDDQRIYAIGFSVGGKAVYEYGLEHAEIFGGFIPIGPAINGSSFVNSTIHESGGRPFYLINGGNDSPNLRFYPMLTALDSNCAIIDSLLMPGVGHTIDFPNRNQILSDAYQWVDSINTRSLSANFSLINPANLSMITCRGFHKYEHYFTWERSPLEDNCGTLKYDVLIDVPNGNFSNPLMILPSDNNGIDTFLTATNEGIDSVIASFGVPLNGFIAFDWVVKSNINNKHSDTTKTFRITFQRKSLGFTLTSPSNNNVVLLENGKNKFFNWEDLNHYISVDYSLLVDDTAADFSNPLMSMNSATNGKSSSLNVNHERLYYNLMFRDNKEIGDSVVIKWNAHAKDSVYSELSVNERVMYLIRGNVGMDLFIPADGSVITSKKGIDYQFKWDTVTLADIRYEWHFDTLGVSLTDSAGMIFGSNNDSLNASITVTYEILDSIMRHYDVEYLDTLYGQWTSKAIHANGSEYALSTYDVTIVRAHPVGINSMDVESTVKVYPNPTQNKLNVKWSSDENWKTLRVLDSEGSILVEKNLNKGQSFISLDVSEFSDGSYIWTLSEREEVMSGIFIINK